MRISTKSAVIHPLSGGIWGFVSPAVNPLTREPLCPWDVEVCLVCTYLAAYRFFFFNCCNKLSDTDVSTIVRCGEQKTQRKVTTQQPAYVSLWTIIRPGCCSVHRGKQRFSWLSTWLVLSSWSNSCGILKIDSILWCQQDCSGGNRAVLVAVPVEGTWTELFRNR